MEVGTATGQHEAVGRPRHSLRGVLPITHELARMKTDVANRYPKQTSLYNMNRYPLRRADSRWKRGAYKRRSSSTANQRSKADATAAAILIYYRKCGICQQNVHMGYYPF